MNLYKKKIYQDALEFIGEVRAGISRERFGLKAVRNFDAFIDFLNDTSEVREFLEQRHIDRNFVIGNLRTILERTYFNPENDYYLTLGLSRKATAEQIHDRWKSLMVVYHPDRNSSDDGFAGRCATKINEAYSVLKDSRKRMEYDRKWGQKRPSPVIPRRELGRDRVIRSTMRGRRSASLSPSMRRALANLILPMWLLFCTLILLFLFFEKKNSGSSGSPSSNNRRSAKETINITADQKKSEDIIARHLELEVQTFLNHYRVAYEQGDMDALFSLFSREKAESSRLNFEGLQQNRQRIFTYSKVKYLINNVEFRDEGEMIMVNGKYRIEVADEEKDNMDVNTVFQGKIRWTLVREGGVLKIAKMDYD